MFQDFRAALGTSTGVESCIDTLPGVGIFSDSIRGFAAGKGWLLPQEMRNGQR
jgi:hypothetical protein